MKEIRQSIEYEGNNHHELQRALKDWHQDHKFSTGLDWSFQYMWATMTDEDCLLFCIKHPQFADRFTDASTNRNTP